MPQSDIETVCDHIIANRDNSQVRKVPHRNLERFSKHLESVRRTCAGDCTTTVISWPRLMNPDLAVEYVGGVSIFDDLVKKKFVKPRVQRKGCTRYDNALDQWPGFDSE